MTPFAVRTVLFGMGDETIAPITSPLDRASPAGPGSATVATETRRKVAMTANECHGPTGSESVSEVAAAVS